MDGFFYWIYTSSRKHKWVYGSVLLLIFAWAGFSVKRLTLEEDISKLIPKDEQITEIEELLSSSRFANLITLHLYQKDTSESAPEKLISIAQSIKDSLQTLQPHLIKSITLEYPDTLVESYYNIFYEYLPFYLDAEDYQIIKERISTEGLRTAMERNFRALISPIGLATKNMITKDPLGLTGLAMARLQEFKPDESLSLYQNHLFTEDKRHLIFFVELASEANETAKNETIVGKLAQLQSAISQSEPSLSFEYFGTPVISVANAKRIKADIMITVSLAMLLLLAVIAFFYRRVTVFFIVVFPGVFGGLIALSVLTYISDSVSSIALGVGSVLLGITVDYALHLFTHFKHQSDIRKLFSDITSPILMSSATTACAFFALLFIRSEALKELGIFAGISVLSAALFTLTVLPHFLSPKKENDEKKKENVVEKIIGSIAAAPLHRKTVVIIIFLIITLFSLFTWRNVSFQTDMTELNYMPENLKQYEKNLNEVTAIAAKKLFVVSSGKDLWEALDNNRPVVKNLDRLKTDGHVLDFSYLNSIIPSAAVQKEKHQRWLQFWEENNPADFVERLNQAAAEKGFKPGTFNEFASKLSNEFRPMSDDDLQRLTGTIGRELIITGDDKVSVINQVKIDPAKKEFVSSEITSSTQANVLDRVYITAKLVQLLSEDFNKLINISLAFVFIFILIVYGRIELTIITFIPIVASWLWTLALMYIFNLKFNIVNIIVCTFIFGLGVDYSIFVMRGLTQKFKTGADNLISYKKSILLSVVTTLSGIGVLIFAQHPALRSIAALAIFGIVSSVLITFSFEILIYNFFIQKRKDKGVAPFTFLTLFLTVFAFIYFLLGCIFLFPIMFLMMIPFASEKKRKYAFHCIMWIFCKSLIYVMVNVKKEFVNRQNIDFSKPSVIIANHHSFVDILLLLSVHPKIVMVTNEWVYHSPFFGKSVRFAGYILAAEGVVSQADQVHQLLRDGYSIVIFPEGTRSRTANLERFHKGAFYLAEQFHLDIQPVVIHGTSFILPKGDDFYLKNGHISAEFLPRIAADDEQWGKTYSERTKIISKYFKAEYSRVRKQRENARYFRELIFKNYIYKSPVLEWYVKAKFWMEKGYQRIHELIPRTASVVDIGCGYGYTSLTLAYTGEERNVLGIDYDEQKIEIAKNVPALPKNIEFLTADAVTFDYSPVDIFLLGDILHYLLPEEQELLIGKLTSNLNKGGKIIIREGDRHRIKRHKKTVLTEKISTGWKFNKTRNDLHFISEEDLKGMAEKLKFRVEVVDETRHTSNVIFILSRLEHGEI